MVRNKTRNTVLADEYILCEGLFKKARGLMFSKKKNLVFTFSSPRKVPLHMFFVFFPIDVIYLDKNQRIIELKEKFLPFTFFSPKVPSKYVLELKTGTIRNSHSEIGDTVEF